MFISYSYRKYAMMRVALAAALIAGIFNVCPAKAETINFGWAQSLGETEFDYGSDIALDTNGNVYSTGFLASSPSNRSSFISKLDGSGNFIWLKIIGGSSSNASYTIEVGGDGSVYIAGSFSGTVDFDPGAGTSNLTAVGSDDIFLSKFDSDGNFLWAKGMGSAAHDTGANIIVDSSGSVYVTGRYSDTVDFDPGPEVSNLSSTGGADAFLSKFDGDGNLLWAKGIGGTSEDAAYGVSIDGNGSVFVSGYFTGTVDFDTGTGTENLTSVQGSDIFISKFHENGNFIWATPINGGESDNAIEIAVDVWGNLYTVGFIGMGGAYDVFLGKLDGNGNILWTQNIGGASFDIGYGIAVDASGNVYFTGDFNGTVDFDSGAGTSHLTSAGAGDIFINKVDGNGNLLWAKSLGGPSGDLPDGIAVDTNGNVYLTGSYSATADFDPGPGTSNLTSAGNGDVFITKLNLTPQIHYVKWDAAGSNDGTSWEDAYTDLQSALAAASNGDEIWVAAGTYKPTTGTDRTISFALKNGVEIYGGFEGTETLLEERDSAANITILSGDLNGDDSNFINNGENSYHVVTGGSTDNTAVLDGFTIMGGNANSFDSMSNEAYGGGLFLLSGSPMLANLTLRGNAAFQGGGLANYNNSSPTLANVTIRSNAAIAAGGGINNSFNSDPTLTNVTLSSNSTSHSGGGIYNIDSNPTLTNVTLNGNSATYGAGMFNNTSNPALANVTLSGNSATSYGGGIYNYFHSDPILNNVTLSGNSAPHGGGGIYNHESSNPTIYNTILWGNGSQIDNPGLSTTTIKDSIVQGGCPGRATCTDIINSDPLLGSLQDNGGFTQTMALGTGSAAIDAGGVNSNCAATDQRGVTRPQSIACDIGAYEHEHEFIEVLYVKPGGFTVGVCESWVQACELRYALSRATAGQQIWVAAGIYTPTSGSDRTISFNLKHRVEIYGGFAGTETLLSQRDPKTNLTILSGDLNGDDSGFTNNDENSYHVVVGSANYGTAVLDGFTITGGNASGSDPNNNGGGLYNYYFGSPKLVNVIIRGNAAAQYGGGVYNDTHSNPALTNVTISGNSAMHGGGIYNEHSSPTLTNMTISGNSAVDGGGMYNRIVGSQPTLTNVTISNNIATSTGGGMYNVLRSLPTLTNVTISGNSAPQGGGLYNSSSSPMLVNVILWGNGAAMNNLGTSAPTIANSIVQGGCPSAASCTNMIDADPLLGVLQDNGGFTETMALGIGSPAINAGNDANCPATDQRGVTRPYGSHCDIGSYEYNSSPVDVIIGDTVVGSYILAAQESQRQSYAGVNDGPVKIMNIDNISMMAAERVIYKVNGVNTSFSEMMGLPDGQVDNTYWLPWYNNRDLDTQLRIANVTDNPATVTVTIGEVEMTPLNLAAGDSTRVSYPRVNAGPVKIESDQDIVAAERVIYKVNGVATSFSETLALPASQLDNTYWLPWYNNRDLDTQLRIANVTDNPATVTITIGGVAMDPLNLAAGESTRVSYPRVNAGPVKIESDQNIVAAARVIYKVNGKNTSFSEMMALPESQLDTTYWLPWYNNKDLDTQLRIANTADNPATVTVTIGGVAMDPLNLDAGESTRVSFPAINNGPVQIVSNVPIVAAERVIYKGNGINTSFSEMMALPNGLLDPTFWFPWYNNKDLDTQMRFGVP